MITLGKYFSNSIDETGHRIIKLRIYGTATADQCAPFGDDSVPVNGMDVIHAETGIDEQEVILGYVNFDNNKAGEGEKRLYALKKVIGDDGSISYQEAFYTWMKADGTYEIGGNTYHAIRYEQTNEALQAQVTKLQAQLTAISAAIGTLGGTYVPGDISIDLSAAKINEIKTL